MAITTEAAPGGASTPFSEGLDTTPTLGANVMPYPQSIHLPVNRRHYEQCGDRDARTNYFCNRPLGHGGRHLFYLRHFTGAVRGVWT